MVQAGEITHGIISFLHLGHLLNDGWRREHRCIGFPSSWIGSERMPVGLLWMRPLGYTVLSITHGHMSCFIYEVSWQVSEGSDDTRQTAQLARDE